MDNQKPNMTRGQYRKIHRPFYKKAPFIITLAVILIAIIGALIYWGVSSTHENNAKDDSNKVEDVQKPTNKEAKKSTTKSAASQKVNKASDKKAVKKNPETKKSYTNTGSYDNLDYKSDDFEFKMANDVKLVKDTSGNSALLIKYTYTNKTDQDQIPQRVQSKNMVLKQDDQVLNATGGDGDYSELVSKANAVAVKPNESAEGALLVKVNNDSSDVNMYFKNIQTNQFINTMQPFKLS